MLLFPYIFKMSYLINFINILIKSNQFDNLYID